MNVGLFIVKAISFCKRFTGYLRFSKKIVNQVKSNVNNSITLWFHRKKPKCMYVLLACLYYATVELVLFGLVCFCHSFLCVFFFHLRITSFLFVYTSFALIRQCEFNFRLIAIKLSVKNALLIRLFFLSLWPTTCGIVTWFNVCTWIQRETQYFQWWFTFHN